MVIELSDTGKPDRRPQLIRTLISQHKSQSSLKRKRLRMLRMEKKNAVLPVISHHVSAHLFSEMPVLSHFWSKN